MRRGAGEGHASAFLGNSPCFRQLRLPLCGDGQNEGKSFHWPRGSSPAHPSLLQSWVEAGFWLGPFWDLKDAGSGGQLGVALDLCVPCYPFCLSLDLLFSGKEAPGVPSLSPSS